MGRPKTKTYEEQLKEKHGDKIENLEPYVNLNTKILHKCNYHNYEYYSTPSSVLGSKTGCPKCGEENHYKHSVERRAFTYEEYQTLLDKKFDGNIVCLEPINNMLHSVKHKCIKHDYVYNTSPSSTLNASCGCKYCAAESTKNKLLTPIDEFKQKVINFSHGKYEACDDYNGNTRSMHFKHIISNEEIHTFEMTPSAFFRGGKCYCENDHLNRLIVDVNDIATKRPDLVKLLHNKDDAISHTTSEKTKLYWDCPNCGKLLYKPINNVSYYGLSCDFCSDGVSYPNKLIYNILFTIKDNLTVLKREWSPKWCKFTLSTGLNKNGVYDIYFEKDNKKYIVEMDGGFHNKLYTHSKLTIEEIKEIDEYKNQLALDHGITLIRINCDYGSTNRFQYILNNILKSELVNIVDLTNVDFEECNKKSLNSLIIDAIELWNIGYGTNKISKILNIL